MQTDSGSDSEFLSRAGNFTSCHVLLLSASQRLNVWGENSFITSSSGAPLVPSVCCWCVFHKGTSVHLQAMCQRREELHGLITGNKEYTLYKRKMLFLLCSHRKSPLLWGCCCCSFPLMHSCSRHSPEELFHCCSSLKWAEQYNVPVLFHCCILCPCKWYSNIWAAADAACDVRTASIQLRERMKLKILT